MWYSDANGQHSVIAGECPSCRGVFLLHDDVEHRETGTPGEVTAFNTNEFLLWPRASARPRLTKDIPEAYASLYNESALILIDSPRASAMLSRRCMQQLLREEVKVPDLRNLYREIEWTLEHGGLPSYVNDVLHEPRILGNLGAHPTKDPEGDYIEVLPGEADWMLDVLETMFDYLFVAKAKTAAMKAALRDRLGN
jgi:hypothetical protein